MRPDRDRAIQHALRARGAEVRFGDRELWTGVDLDIPTGTFTAILGPNGVGKSTLLKVFLGLQRLSAGWVEVLGSPAGRVSTISTSRPQVSPPPWRDAGVISS